jgi:2-succinyl-5-enolpyruvyl-6-hydroxy-3-cyclohexene-1-carboxylate synthase
VVRFGDVPVSKALNLYLERTQPPTLIHVAPDGTWSDDSHMVTHVLTGDSATVAAQLLNEAPARKPGAFWATLYRMEQATWRVIDEAIETGAYFDGAVVYDVVDLIPDGSTLFAGNSLPVRHLDQFGKPTGKRLYTYANRGASGIDGNLSSALGAGAVRPAAPLVAVVGDVTFYHDMNGLLAVHRCGVPVTIVLLNNDGGGIFHRLPIRNYEPEFTHYFLTRHGLDFSHAANLYGLEYIRADTRDTFRDAFQQQMNQPDRSAIIEVRTDSYQDNQRRQAIMQQVQQRIRDLNLPDTP